MRLAGRYTMKNLIIENKARNLCFQNGCNKSAVKTEILAMYYLRSIGNVCAMRGDHCHCSCATLQK